MADPELVSEAAAAVREPPIPHAALRTAHSAVSAAHFRAQAPLQFRGRLIAAGDIRNVLDKPAGMFIPAHALETAVAHGQFDNLACFIDHAGPFDGPSLRDLFGAWTNIHYNVAKQSVDGTLNVYDTEPNRQIAHILAQTLAPGQPSPDIGVSIVFYGDWQNADRKRTLTRFHKIESADLVFMPASSDSRILEALSTLNRNPVEQRGTLPVSNKGEHPMPEKTPEATRQDPPNGNNPKSATSKRKSGPSQVPKLLSKEDPIPHSELRSPNLDEVVTPEFVELQEQLGERWLDEIKQEGLRIIFDNADLPDVIKRRIMRKTYRSPEEVRAAIEEAHEELQELEAEETIDLGQSPLHLRRRAPRPDPLPRGLVLRRA